MVLCETFMKVASGCLVEQVAERINQAFKPEQVGGSRAPAGAERREKAFREGNLLVRTVQVRVRAFDF